MRPNKSLKKGRKSQINRRTKSQINRRTPKVFKSNNSDDINTLTYVDGRYE